MAAPEFTDHDMDRLLLVCRAYDAGIVASGVIAIIAGHLAGGAGISAIGLAALTYTLVAGVRHAADRASRVEERTCTPR